MVATGALLVADECWVALASLHRAHPERSSFSAREILDRAKQQKAHPEVRAGVQAHIYQHNVANTEPSSARYRMFYKLDDGAYRLYRPGDDFHPSRKGKTMPEASDLPERYHDLLDWYKNEYCLQNNPADENSDPLLQLRGVGKELWKAAGGGDAYIARERAAWDDAAGEREVKPAPSVAERVWNRIIAHQDETFQTARRLSFTYKVEGETGLWFYRNGRRVNQRLSRAEVKKAVSRCPLEKTTEINDLRDYAYLYGLLTDRRIRGSDW